MPERTFQTGHQISLYRTGKDLSAEHIPLAVEDLESKARERLSPEDFDWIAGAAGGGGTLRNNLSAFEKWRIIPRMLCDISQRDFRVEVHGKEWSAPFALAPIGVQAPAHPDAECASASAAGEVGVPFILSNVATRTLEEVALAAPNTRRWFQLYWPRDPELAASFVRRAEAAGYEAIVVTLDTPSLGWRERNLELAHLPFLRGIGLANYFADPVFCSRLTRPPEEDVLAAAELYLQIFSDLSRTWKNLADLRALTQLPLWVKGVQHADDARQALGQGVDGIVVSNHGGRQTDGSVATLDVLASVVEAVEGHVPVLFDSGIRRGSDVFKALALGAKAVLVGRPYLYALTVGGQRGVTQWLKNLQADFDLTAGLAGKSQIDQITFADLQRV